MKKEPLFTVYHKQMNKRSNDRVEVPFVPLYNIKLILLPSVGKYPFIWQLEDDQWITRSLDNVFFVDKPKLKECYNLGPAFINFHYYDILPGKRILFREAMFKWAVANGRHDIRKTLTDLSC